MNSTYTGYLTVNLITYPNISNQDKESHKAIYQVNPGIPLHVQLKGVAVPTCDQSQLWISILETASGFTKKGKTIILEKYEHTIQTESNTATCVSV